MTRLLSGIQPTGTMHLGNYFGAVLNWVACQSTHDTFLMVADWHALTSLYKDPSSLKQFKTDLVLDLLACGIDPTLCRLFYQSDVPEHSELHLILSMITPLPWLERVPTYKGKMDESGSNDLHTYGFLGYPLLQTADIILYKATAVPVGKDQLPHLELSREIVRHFNHLYGPVFPEPEPLLTTSPVLPGIDGRKMSKSYKNTIPISGTEEDTRKLVMSMFTDPTRLRRTDPGHPETCPVYSYHELLNTAENTSQIALDCRSATLGCVDCKRLCATLIVDTLTPIRDKRATLERDTSHVAQLLEAGAQSARLVARQTILEVREAMGI